MPFFTSREHHLFYREQGEGELLLILPGNTASSACHEGELAYFSTRYHAVSMDFRGTGQSGRMDTWPDDWWEQGAHDAAALCHHLGYADCHVLGTSGGAITALLMAIRHPELVRSVIADSAAEFFPYPTLTSEVRERNARTPEQVTFWQLAHGDDWKQVITADSDLLLRAEKTGGSRFKNELHKIQCPVLFTASLEDECLPDVGTQTERMARQVKNSRVFLSPHGFHPLMWSREDDFRNAADTFLGDL